MSTMIKSLNSVLILATFVFGMVPGARGASAELRQGRYIGWLKLESRKERLAIVADFFLVSPEDFTKFPRLTASFKLSLGGYGTHEYFTETFKDLKYDFDHGNLTFDEPGSDLIMTTKVSEGGGRTKITGQVLIKSSAEQGSIEITEESDEPEDDISPERSTENSPFVSLLDGQYVGFCEEKEAVLQIQTVRGLTVETERDGERGNDFDRNFESYYGIAGRLAYKTDTLCGKMGPNQWCTRHHFRNGSYNIYLGKLNFLSDISSEQCEFVAAELKCSVRSFDKTVSCAFKKKNNSAAALFYSRRYHVKASEVQLRDLPNPAPPQNSELASALKGKFFGFLHNETNDTYTGVRLDVLPFSSTHNPHNPNQIMVSSSASLFLGSISSGDYVTQRFEPRSFYLRPGFVLSGPSADSVIGIADWKQGYIRGVWYSHAFGRVGTVQLIKDMVPTLPHEAKLVRSFSGEFDRKQDSITQRLRFLFPVQPNHLKDHIVKFNGSYQTIVGNTPIREMDRGVYDPYTGRIGWFIKRDQGSTFGSGVIGTDGNAHFFWPPMPLLGVLTKNYEFEFYQRR